MVEISGPELAISYPPQSAFFIGEENERSDILELPQDAIRVISVGSAGDSAGVDAFGRSRVSEPFTIGDYKHLYAIDPNFLDSLNAGGTVSFATNQAAATLATGTSSGSYAIHQTKLYHHYQPGKSQLVLSSFNFGYARANVTKRTGYFDDRDGIYFEQVGLPTSNGTDAGTLNWVIRSYVTGTASETGTRVPQSQWNVDRCDGTGKSGFNLDISKVQLIFVDFQWLGVGRVRCGFVHNGQYIIAHEYYHSNIDTTVYLANPNLPVRCEIRNTANISASATFSQICSSVMAEGGYVQSGIDWSIDSGALRQTSTVGTTRLPVLVLRLKNTYQGYLNRAIVKLNNVTAYIADNPAYVEIIKIPNASYLVNAGGTSSLTWTSANTNSVVEYSIDAAAFTGSSTVIEVLSSLVIPAGSSGNSQGVAGIPSATDSKKNFIAQNYDSTNSEVYVISVKTIDTGLTRAKASVTAQWREIY
jgi:hypothetical protein